MRRSFEHSFKITQQGTTLNYLATLKLASDLLPTKGADSATFGRTGEQAIIDHDGIYRYVSAGCAGFPGARQVTNIFLYSEDFSNANWTKNFVTRTTESILGPVSGNVTATKLTGDGTSNQHYLGQNVTTPQNNTYLRFSALVKKGTGRYVCLFYGGLPSVRAVFDFDTASFIEPLVSTSLKFWAEPLANGWFWINIVDLTNTLSTACRLYPSSSSTFATSTTFAESIYVLKMQVSDIMGAVRYAPIQYVATTATKLTESFGTVPNNQQISAWGDSLTSEYPTYIHNRTPERITNTFTWGGHTSSGVLGHFLENPSRFADIAVIWSGSNNFGTASFDYVQAELDIATMVTTLGHNKFVVLTALNGEYSDRYIGTTGYNQMMIFNNWIAATYPDNYIDIRTYLVSQYNASIPQDVIDHGHDIHPSSLRIDTIHLNLTGNTLVAIQVFNFLKTKGWISETSITAPIEGLNGLLLEPARTNFTTAYGLNDIVSLNGAPTGMTKSGNSTATLKVSSQSTFINSLFGLGPVAQTYNKCYEFDNSLGGSGDAIVTIDGASATSPQSYSVYAQVLTGSATLQNDSAEGAVVFNNALPAIVKSENVIVAGSRKLQIVVPIGCKIYFCLQQAEVGTKCTSFMATYGATAARAATTATLPIPATSTKVKTTETKAATVDVIRNIADYITTIKVGTANDGIYTEPVQIKDLKVY